MIDNYSLFGIAVRTVTAVILMLVIMLQVKEFRNGPKPNDDLKPLKKLLFTAVVLLFISNAFAILVNAFRADDGNLIDTARRFSTIFNSTAALMTSITLYLVYKFRAKD